MTDRLKHMDEAGVEVQILSSSPLMPTCATPEAATHAARFINDLLADLSTTHPDRFRLVATLPMLHPDAALAEIDRVDGSDHQVGFAMTTSTAGKVLTDPLFLPVWQELDRRKACVVLHPAGVNACSPLLSDDLTWPVGSPIEIRCSGPTDRQQLPGRFPGVTIVNAHFGGVLPMVVNRLDRQLPHADPGLVESPSAAVGRMFYDTVGQGSVPALQAAMAALGAERLLLGTDFPYQKDAAYVSAIDYVRAGSPGRDHEGRSPRRHRPSPVLPRLRPGHSAAQDPRHGPERRLPPQRQTGVVATSTFDPLCLRASRWRAPSSRIMAGAAAIPWITIEHTTTSATIDHRSACCGKAPF